MIAGLSAADERNYAAALRGDTDIAIRVLTLTLSHRLVASIDPLIFEGQQNWTAGDGSNVTKTATLNMFDPDHALRLDSAAPTAGMSGLDRLIQVRSYVRPPGLGYWISAPAITGRPINIDRDGDTVQVEIQGKESLHLREVDAWTIRKGSNRVAAIKLILQRAGETRFRFPTGYRAVLPVTITVGGQPDRMPWTIAWKLARGMGLQLYYDAMGYACLRKYPTAPMWTLTENGPGANLAGPVKVSSNLSTIRNRVVVRGHTVPTRASRGQPARASRLVIGTAVLPASHPHSAQTLAFNGEPWYNTAYYDEPNLHTQTECVLFARDRLEELAADQLSVETTTAPFWHAEPLDLIRLDPIAGLPFNFRLKDASASYTTTDMTIGYNWPLSRPTTRGVRGLVA